MKSTITYGGQKIQVDIISPAPESGSTIPPAGVHPVVQAKGKMLSLLSPVELAVGASFSLESGYDIPYSVLVQSSFSDGHDRFHVLGVIGG